MSLTTISVAPNLRAAHGHRANYRYAQRPTPAAVAAHQPAVRRREPILFQAQLEPTALSVLAMLLPAPCTFDPWELACS